MEEFPFTEAEWTSVVEAAVALVNATAMNDAVLSDVSRDALVELLAGLSQRYGEHPVLLETAADFASSRVERIRLYHRALRMAERESFATTSIRSALRSMRVIVEKVTLMPRISEFYGIAIYMYYRDHAPPHIHAFYGEFEAAFEIASGSIIAGQFPRRATALLQEWIVVRNVELLNDWKLAEQSVPLLGISPLD